MDNGSDVNVYIVDTGIRTSHDEFMYADGSPGSRAREGLEWVKDNFIPPAAVVMALGGESQYALDLAVAEVVQAGVPVMVAAGNEDTDACLTSPAREPLAITVSATDQNDSRLWVSAGTGANYGTCVDIWAPGYDILSASNTADNATEYRSGTSQAVPFVAGAVAIYLQNNTEASPLEVNTALMSSSSWGVVHESNASGPLNAGVLNYTNNVLVNTAMFHAVNFEPQSIQITGGADGFGPFFVNVTLAQAPVGSVAVSVSLSNASRAAVTPQQLLFTPNNWSVPQLLKMSTAAEAYQSVDSDDFYIQLDLTSNDTNFNNTHPRLQGGSAPDAFQQEAERSQDLMQDKGFLLLRVQTLRQGLSDWRTKLNDQFRDDQEEKGSLNTALKTEVSQLRSEVNQLKDTLAHMAQKDFQLAA
ncbi:hypothetical protein WJX79_001179 [Trebouxia sp. C0005]